MNNKMKGILNNHVSRGFLQADPVSDLLGKQKWFKTYDVFIFCQGDLSETPVRLWIIFVYRKQIAQNIVNEAFFSAGLTCLEP